MSASRLEQLDGFHARGRDLLFSQTRALDAVIHDLVLLDPDKDDPAVRVPLLMLQAVGVSIHSVLALTAERSMSIRDGFGITRSAVETALNAAYISVGGKPRAEQAIRHMRQKRWRDLRREARIGSLRITASRDIGQDISDFPGLQEAQAEFTGRKGKERNWSETSIDDRAAAVGAVSPRAGICLGAAIFGIYRPGSELLHGSYYGVNLFWQGSRDTPAVDRNSFDELWVMEHFVTLLSCLCLGVSGAVDAIAAVHDWSVHAEVQNLLSEQLQLLTDEMSGTDPDDEHHFSAVPR